MSRPATGRWASVASVVMLLTALLLPTGAAAQLDEPPAPLPLRLHAIQATVAEQQPGTIRVVVDIVAGPTARSDLRLVANLGARATSAAELRLALEGEPATVFASTATDLPDLPAGTISRLPLSIDPADLDLVGEERAGVYPLQLGVFQGPELVGQASTAVIVTPATQPDPLPATMVVGIRSDVAPLTGDLPSPDMVALLDPDGSLVRQVRDLAATAADGTAAGLTVAVSGRLLGDLEELGNGYLRPQGGVADSSDRLARRAARVVEEVRRLLRRGDTSSVAYPYGPADLVALVRGGEADEAVRLVGVGRQAARQVTGSTPSGDVVVPPDGLDAPTVAALGPLGPPTFLLDERYLAFADDDALSPLRRLRTADGGEIHLAMPDEGLSDLLRDPRGVGTASVTQQLLAETAITWMEEVDPSTGVLLHVDIPRDLPDGMLSAVNGALGQADWLRPMGLDRLIEVLRPSDRVARLAYPPSSRAAELDTGYIRQLGQAREALVPIRALLPSEEASPEEEGEGEGAAPAADLATDFGRSLLVAPSIPYRQEALRPEGEARIQLVLDTLEGLGEAVSVVEGPPVTLTSATGEIPVTLVNEATVPLNVRVQVGSTGFAIEQPERELQLPADSVQTITFSARARNPGGTAGLGVSVQDPSGAMTLVATTLAVRSTAFPVVAVLATVGGVLVLVLWGLREGRRRRHNRQVREAIIEADRASA